MKTGRIIRMIDFPRLAILPGGGPPACTPVKPLIREYDEGEIIEALEQYGWAVVPKTALRAYAAECRLDPWAFQESPERLAMVLDAEQRDLQYQVMRGIQEHIYVEPADERHTRGMPRRARLDVLLDIDKVDAATRAMWLRKPRRDR